MENKLEVLPSECDCEKCSSMCHAPCCGTWQDINELMDKGYGARLMLDDREDASPIPSLINPALKGYEGEKAPVSTATWEGCTFWKDGKCELHSLGLKPIQGKLSHHDLNKNQMIHIEILIVNSWKEKEAKGVIDRWKKEYLKKPSN